MIVGRTSHLADNGCGRRRKPWTEKAHVGGAVWAGAAIVNGTVYWGTGYHTEGFGYHGDNNKLYAFTPYGR